MRELSLKEQQIIRDQLIPGTTLTELFSGRFNGDGKIEIQIHEDGDYRFDFYSQTFSETAANIEVVDVINLLKYLEAEGLITKYPPAATTMVEFEVGTPIVMGSSNSQKAVKFLMITQSASLVKYLKKNAGFVFQANEPLRVLAGNNFRSLQERQFERTISTTLRGQWISIGIAGLTLLVSCAVNIVNWHRSDQLAKSLKSELVALRERFKGDSRLDSILFRDASEQIRTLRYQVDSLTRAVSLKEKPVGEKQR